MAVSIVHHARVLGKLKRAGLRIIAHGGLLTVLILLIVEVLHGDRSDMSSSFLNPTLNISNYLIERGVAGLRVPVFLELGLNCTAGVAVLSLYRSRHTHAEVFLFNL